MRGWHGDESRCMHTRGASPGAWASYPKAWLAPMRAAHLADDCPCWTLVLVVHCVACACREAEALHECIGGLPPLSRAQPRAVGHLHACGQVLTAWQLRHRRWRVAGAARLGCLPPGPVCIYLIAIGHVEVAHCACAGTPGGALFACTPMHTSVFTHYEPPLRPSPVPFTFESTHSRPARSTMAGVSWPPPRERCGKLGAFGSFLLYFQNLVHSFVESAPGNAAFSTS
jgi:hypothetical protein